MTNHIPEGFHSLTPYLMLDDPEAFVAFVEAAFGATRKMMNYDDGVLQHGEVDVEGSIIELTQARPEYPAVISRFHLFVADPDATFAKALEAGATVTYELTDHEYGERSGGVVDPCGNHWYIARVTDHAKRSGAQDGTAASS